MPRLKPKKHTKPVLTIYIEESPWGAWVLSYDEYDYNKEEALDEPQQITEVDSEKEAIRLAEKYARINAEKPDYEYVVVHLDGSEHATFYREKGVVKVSRMK